MKQARARESAHEWASWTHASLSTVSSTLRSAGSTLVTGIKAGYEHLATEQVDKEKILGISFSYLEWLNKTAEDRCRVLMLTYSIGFQVWTLNGKNVKELVSRREEPIRCLQSVPLPAKSRRAQSPFLQDWPLLAMLTDCRSGEEPGQEGAKPSSTIKLYSLQRHAYVHVKDVSGYVLKLACSPCVLLVAMSAQILAYDICTMEMSFSTITYPSPSRVLAWDDALLAKSVPLALGTRWLAHASDQAVQTASGVALGHALSNGSGSSSRNNLEAVQHLASQAAKKGGKQLKSLGEVGYRYISGQVESWRGNGIPSSDSESQISKEEAEIVGTVIVRDVVSRSTVAHFRAHTSPLSLLEFDGTGMLLVTASVHGHTISIFRIAPPADPTDGIGSATHLYRLQRGVTPAVIQSVAFSSDGRWLCASSARGTTHIFRLDALDKSEGLPPCLEAMNALQPAQKALLPQKLGAIGRARAPSLLSTSIPGSAVASSAIGFCSSSSGGCILASTFAARPEGSDNDADLLAEDMWIASDAGQLFRHKLSPASRAEPQSPASGHQAESPHRAPIAESSQTEMVIEAIERFDICRRQSWAEREDLLTDSNSSIVENQSSANPAWASCSEVSIPGTISPPLWTDSQFHILEMQTHAENPVRMEEEGLESFNVEQLPTRRVDLPDENRPAPVIIEGAETAVLRGVQVVGALD